MHKKMYVLYVNTPGGANTTSIVEKVIDEYDWARLRGAQVYLISSFKSAKEIRNIVQAVLNQNDHVLVVEANMQNHSGWLSNNTADWIKKNLTQ
jgi:hypothetical protein